MKARWPEKEWWIMYGELEKHCSNVFNFDRRAVKLTLLLLNVCLFLKWKVAKEFHVKLETQRRHF